MADLFGGGKKRDKDKAGPASSGYTAKDIEVLEGLEPVRRRPGMYVGGTDERALHHLVAEVLDNAMDEAVAGHADRIEVELSAEGTSRRRGARQRDGRGRGRTRRPHRGRALGRGHLHDPRQWPRHTRRPAPEVPRQVGARGDPHHAAFRRQVLGQGLLDGGRPARRRHLGRQRALRRAGRRGRAREDRLAAALQPRRPQGPGAQDRHHAEPPRHERRLPPRPRDLRQGRASQGGHDLPHGARQGLPLPRRRTALVLRPVAGEGRRGPRRGRAALPRRPRRLPRRGDREAALRGPRQGLLRRGEAARRPRSHRMGRRLAGGRARRNAFLRQHRADAAGRLARARPALGAVARPARLRRAPRQQARAADHRRGRRRRRGGVPVAVHPRAAVPGPDQGPPRHAGGAARRRRGHQGPFRPLAGGRPRQRAAVPRRHRRARRGPHPPAQREGDAAQERDAQAAPARQARRLLDQRGGRHRDLPGRGRQRRRLREAGARPRHPGRAAAARQDPERRERLRGQAAPEPGARRPRAGAGLRHGFDLRRGEAALRARHHHDRRRRRRRAHRFAADDVLLPRDVAARG